MTINLRSFKFDGVIELASVEVMLDKSLSLSDNRTRGVFSESIISHLDFFVLLFFGVCLLFPFSKNNNI